MSLRGRYSVKTEPLRTERRLEQVMVLLLLALLLLLAWGGYRLSVLQRPDVVLPAADSLTVRQTLRPPPVSDEQSALLRERPLFWASRRPSAPVEQTTNAGDDKVGQVDGIRLVGVIGSGKSAGIIVTVNGSARKRLHVGDKVNGWKLEQVSGDEAVIKAGGRSKTLVLGKKAEGTAKTNARAARKSKRARRVR